MDYDQFVDMGNTDFKVGDLVEFEIGNSDGMNRPRWVDGVDHGSTGIWARGHIEEITNEDIVVKYWIKDYVGYGICTFPNRGSIHYYAWQNNRDGFLRKRAQIFCECGSDTVYGQFNTLHSSWCPKYE